MKRMAFIEARRMTARFGALAALALGSAGCSDQPKDDWYERSSQAAAEEAHYVDVHRSLGISENDAKAVYAGRIFWDATEGRDKKFVKDKQDMETGNPGREVPR